MSSLYFAGKDLILAELGKQFDVVFIFCRKGFDFGRVRKAV
jgi:hypothetical protein